MSRGPAPKPTALRIIAGNPANRPLPENEPMPDVEVPTCPTHLNPHAKREWKRISKILETLGLVTQVDRAALAMYCQAWGRWVEAEKQAAKEADVIISDKGIPIKNPYLTIANEAYDRMHRLICEFGMTPASRTRVSAAPRKKENRYARHGRKAKVS